MKLDQILHKHWRWPDLSLDFYGYDPWLVSKFRFSSISYERIDWIWFCICIDLNEIKVGIVSANFRKFTTGLGQVIIFRISIPLNILRRINKIRPNFAYALMVASSRLELLRLNVRKYTTQLWPLVTVRISFRSRSCENVCIYTGLNEI